MSTGLCTNRPEGFGPMSVLASPLPTQCFFDTIVVPLPTWLYLASIPLLFFLAPRDPSSTSSSSSSMPSLARHRTSSAVSLGGTWRHSWRRIALFAAYYFVLAVLALMESVEVVQLGGAALGVGLLPFVYVGLAGAALLQATDGLALVPCFRRRRRRVVVRGYWAAAAAAWVAGAAVTTLKAVGLVLALGLAGPRARADGPYPTVHQLTDLVILAIFYALAVALEVAVAVLRRRTCEREARRDDVVELRSEFDWKD